MSLFYLAQVGRVMAKITKFLYIFIILFVSAFPANGSKCLQIFVVVPIFSHSI
jgi:hypothetical protein